MAKANRSNRMSVGISLETILIALCILESSSEFSCNSVDSNDVAHHCYSNVSEARSEVASWNISTQEELNRFLELKNVTSFTGESTNRCIRLYFTGESFKLDIIKLKKLIMSIKLGTGGGLVMIGVAIPHRVKIHCVANATSLLEPLANISLVALDGLVFTRCPVPVIIEEVCTVIVQNCDFM